MSRETYIASQPRYVPGTIQKSPLINRGACWPHGTDPEIPGKLVKVSECFTMVLETLPPPHFHSPNGTVWAIMLIAQDVSGQGWWSVAYVTLFLVRMCLLQSPLLLNCPVPPLGEEKCRNHVYCILSITMDKSHTCGLLSFVSLLPFPTHSSLNFQNSISDIPHVAGVFPHSHSYFSVRIKPT